MHFSRRADQERGKERERVRISERNSDRKTQKGGGNERRIPLHKLYLTAPAGARLPACACAHRYTWRRRDTFDASLALGGTQVRDGSSVLSVYSAGRPIGEYGWHYPGVSPPREFVRLRRRYTHSAGIHSRMILSRLRLTIKVTWNTLKGFRASAQGGSKVRTLSFFGAFRNATDVQSETLFLSNSNVQEDKFSRSTSTRVEMRR